MHVQGSMAAVAAANASPAATSTGAVKMASDGMWQGENPLEFALPLLAVQVAVILVVTQGVALALRLLRQPRVFCCFNFMLAVVASEDLANLVV